MLTHPINQDGWRYFAAAVILHSGFVMSEPTWPPRLSYAATHNFAIWPLQKTTSLKHHQFYVKTPELIKFK
jgi:hypothetical protein